MLIEDIPLNENEMANNRIRFIAYGSLRKGGFNYKSLSSVEYIKSLEIKGFEMYSLGAFPGVTQGGKNSLIKADILEVDLYEFLLIQRMEFDAGYRQEYVEVDGEKYPIFIFEYTNFLKKCKKINNGDYIDFISR